MNTPMFRHLIRRQQQQPPQHQGVAHLRSLRVCHCSGLPYRHTQIPKSTSHTGPTMVGLGSSRWVARNWSSSRAFGLMPSSERTRRYREAWARRRRPRMWRLLHGPCGQAGWPGPAGSVFSLGAIRQIIYLLQFKIFYIDII